MTNHRIATYTTAGKTAYGAVTDRGVIDLSSRFGKDFPTLREAISALDGGEMARAALGDDVVDHYLNYARTEQELFDRVVTNWERERLYERG